jgi:hypothetical protein
MKHRHVDKCRRARFAHSAKEISERDREEGGADDVDDLFHRPRVYAAAILLGQGNPAPGHLI